MNSIKKENITIKNIFLFIIVAAYILSNALVVVLKTTSLRDSMLLEIIIYAFILMIVNKKSIFTINKRYFTIIILFFMLISLQFAFSRIVFKDVDVIRFISSYLLMLTILLIAPFLSNFMELIDGTSYNKVMNLGYYFMTTIGVASISLIRLNLAHGRNMIIFAEPSHFALVYLPFLFYKVYSSKKNKRLIYIAIGLFVAIAVENLTLLIGIFLTLLLVYFKKKNVLIIIISMSVLAIKFGGIGKIAYFSDRIQMSSSTTNLSALVWLSGWERAYLSFKSSYGLGVGFQQMGVVGDLGQYMYSIYRITNGDYLNLFDGGSIASKLITEMGILGLVLIIFYILYFLKITKVIIKNHVKSSRELFFFSIYIMGSIALFVRGSGYFSPSSFMFFVAVYWISFKGNLNQKDRSQN